MKIGELKEYLNSLPKGLDECAVKIQGIREDKDYVDLEITTLKQNKKQLIKYGLIFELV